MDALILVLPLLIGWGLDLLFGDPRKLPHLVVGFGKLIALGERWLNRGSFRKIKGAVCSLALIVGSYLITEVIIDKTGNAYLSIAIQAVLIFYCLSGTTLVSEVEQVFAALENGLEKGRNQVGRIVGRDTQNLSANEVRCAALETLAENLSDGVVAPIFWYILLGVPGMVAYKMVNTLDSMIGYKTQKYKDFGCVAACIDDFANYIPARITSMLMVMLNPNKRLFSFVLKYGPKHLSPNSGYPEAALAGILNCRFGGSHNYFGENVYKPFIGENERELTAEDMKIAVALNRKVECVMILISLILKLSF